MDEIIISNGDSPLISQPSPVLIGGEPSVVVQENFVGGQNSTIEIGSVETLPEGSQAYVTNVGTPTHAVLNFGLVTGNTGETGAAGTDGTDGLSATITVGTVTTGLPDSNATVVNVGTPNAAILDFSIPRGSKGDQGDQGVAGVDGISPRAYVEQITGGARVVIEDSETTTTADIMNGVDGTDGTDGFSPVATVTPTASGATISITDSQGTTTANITNGIDGVDGTNGTDGFSPVATVTQTSSGATISITDSQGTTTANITNGIDGVDGTNGADGFSPVATVTQSGVDAVISITDQQGTTSATVYGTGVNLNYSYNEIDTGLTWVNGSKIYSKSYYFSQLANRGVVSQTLPTGYTSTVKLEGTMRQGTSAWALPYPNCYMDTANGNLEVANPNYDFRNMNAIITLYYTK